jgi:thymidylate synthase
MHFSQSRVTADERDVEHDNHIHIDWIDNRRTQRSTAVSSFRYKDQRGEHVKNVGAYGQPIAMFWNAGATSANFDDFRAGLDALNANIESRRTVLSAMRLADFQALY